MKLSRARGRPRGRGRSTTDFRLLEYLVLISMKYEIGRDDLFKGFIEAWKHQRSMRKNLSIECRERTQSRAVFLITNGSRVVAQFSIPQHILEEANSLKEFKYARVPIRAVREKGGGRHLRIGDLKSGMKRINLKAKVVEVHEPRSVTTRFGGATVANASIADETGIIQLPLWNKQIFAFSVGDTIQVEKARIVKFRGQRQLRGGKLSVVRREPA